MAQEIYYISDETEQTVYPFSAERARTLWNGRPLYIDFGHNIAEVYDSLTEAFRNYSLSSADTLRLDSNGDLWIYLCD